MGMGVCVVTVLGTLGLGCGKKKHIRFIFICIKLIF